MSLFRLSSIGCMTAMLGLFGGTARAAINIVPLPATMTPGAGSFSVGAGDVISIYRDAGSDSTVPWVAKLFTQAKVPVSYVAASAGAKVVITMAADANLGAEGYKLSVSPTQITITAPTLTGQFYAVQSLRQMFPSGIEDSTSGIKAPFTIPQVDITDKPRFEYRGSMIDPVRKFCPLPYLYQHIDRMALYKLNRLHLLVSNDQGFRVESLVFPLLISKGATTNCGGGHPAAGERWYYTQDEVRAFVKYADLRHVKIIPEIDMPGHCTAMCYAYPNLGTPNNAVQTSEAVGLSIMNATGPNAQYVNDFIGKLWREMATMFTSDQYQIGGDECVNIAATDFHNFALRVQDTLAAIGKKAIAWDEVAAANAVRAGNWSQDWHQGASSGQIKSSCDYLYLDMANKQGDPSTNNWCVTSLSLQKVYSTPFTGNTLRGLEGTLFTERVSIYPDYWDRQIWPRQAAIAEIGWATTNNDVNGFVSREGFHGSRYGSMGIKFYNTSGVTWDATTIKNNMTNLYDHFVPVIQNVGVYAHGNKHAAINKNLVGKGQKAYNSLGRVIRISPNGFPESIQSVFPQ